MNIKDEFRKALKNTSRINPQFDKDFLLGICAAEPSSEFADFSLLLAGGYFTPAVGFTCEFQDLDCYLLLYTVEGGGRLLLEKTPVSLTEQSLILFQGQQHFSLSLVQAPWKFYLFYFTGRELEAWHKVLGERCFYLDRFTQKPALEPIMERFLQFLLRTDRGTPLLVNRLLTDFFTELSLWDLPETAEPSSLPAHVSWMKHWCDTCYSEHFSLDEMAYDLKMSKYKICRDFSAHMHISPLQYLNAQRMEAAKSLLINTDYCVYEIGNAVGIENTNHFINLFKKNAGTTPNEFRHLHQK